MPCKLCGQDRELIQAHIIPRSFFEIDPSTSPRILSNAEGRHPRRSPSGIYDPDLVCELCERVFAPYDDYAQDLLLRRREAQEPIVCGGEPIAFLYRTVDYCRLKLFFLAVLWRASRSTHDFFSSVDLGSHEVTVREAILSGNPGDAEPYAVVLARFPQQLGMLNPHSTRFSDVNFVQIYLAEYVAYLKVDQRLTPEPFREFVFTPGAPLVILGRDPVRSRDVNVMRDIARADTHNT